ncbi:hypothetical protein BC829DRAFT_446759 [Chytridium lagenaria]|nr:hypothetical protein BC829DRAFT_446759 [Chytridium lagenaria]
MKNNNLSTSPENTFHDLSSRTTIFRSKLLEEFQLLDNVQNSRGAAPTHTLETLQTPRLELKFFLENPHQLIKFQVFKRSQKENDGVQKTDRRLTRTRNINSLPIGAWAGWVVEKIALKWTDNFEEFWQSGWNMLIKSNSRGFLEWNRRTFRIVRVFKIVLRSANLKIVSMTYITVLVIVVAYIYAIVGIYLYKNWTISRVEKLVYRDSFQDIGSSFKTLFQLLTLDQWDPLNREAARFIDPIWSHSTLSRGVPVNNFEKISDNLKEQKDEVMKLKRFEKMRRKLNKELAVQGNMRKSLTNLKNPDGGSYEPLAGEEADGKNNINELKDMDKDHDILQSIQKLLVASHGMSRGWEATVAETLMALASSQSETMWPRDTLFKYLQLMENLQENMKEYEELQLLASVYGIMNLNQLPSRLSTPTSTRVTFALSAIPPSSPSNQKSVVQPSHHRSNADDIIDEAIFLFRPNAFFRNFEIQGGEFAIPGEAGFPLTSMYEKPATRGDADLLRQYFAQLRQEMG